MKLLDCHKPALGNKQKEEKFEQFSVVLCTDFFKAIYRYGAKPVCLNSTCIALHWEKYICFHLLTNIFLFFKIIYTYKPDKAFFKVNVQP